MNLRCRTTGLEGIRSGSFAQRHAAPVRPHNRSAGIVIAKAAHDSPCQPQSREQPDAVLSRRASLVALAAVPLALSGMVEPAQAIQGLTAGRVPGESRIGGLAYVGYVHAVRVRYSCELAAPGCGFQRATPWVMMSRCLQKPQVFWPDPGQLTVELLKAGTSQLCSVSAAHP